MKRRYSLFILLLLLIGTINSACSPGHLGNNVIGFLRDGQLWTIDPDGTNPYAIVKQDMPVISYSWSPDHRLVAFRALDKDTVQAQKGQQLAKQPLTGQIEDAVSSLNTVGVDGGTPIMIAFSSTQVRYNTPIWNPPGTRLLYRQAPLTTPGNPQGVSWWISQDDQPGGIAVKAFPSSYSIPSFSYDSGASTIAGNAANGLFTTNQAGEQQRFLQQEPLSGHPLPATLERVLWQPAHQPAALLYAISRGQVRNGIPLVQLILRTGQNTNTVLTTCTCEQFAWSPDGNYILYSEGDHYTLLDINRHSTSTLQVETQSIPYWSPDSRFLLLDGPHSLQLVNISQGTPQVLLTDSSSAPVNQHERPAATNALLQPVANNLWSADGRQFLFQARGRLQWQGGKTLPTGNGLYTVTLNNQGVIQGTPVLVTTGNITQPGWTYEDANTSFLY